MCSARSMSPTCAISFAELSGWFGSAGGCGGQRKPDSLAKALCGETIPTRAKHIRPTLRRHQTRGASRNRSAAEIASRRLPRRGERSEAMRWQRCQGPPWHRRHRSRRSAGCGRTRGEVKALGFGGGLPHLVEVCLKMVSAQSIVGCDAAFGVSGFLFAVGAAESGVGGAGLRLAPLPPHSGTLSRRSEAPFLPEIGPLWAPGAFLMPEIGPERNPGVFRAAGRLPSPAPPGGPPAEIDPDAAPGAFPSR